MHYSGCAIVHMLWNAINSGWYSNYITGSTVLHNHLLSVLYIWQSGLIIRIFFIKHFRGFWINQELVYFVRSSVLLSQKLRCIRKVAFRLLNAVGFLQSRKIIHADLKPDNLLLSRGSDVIGSFILLPISSWVRWTESLLGCCWLLATVFFLVQFTNDIAQAVAVAFDPIQQH